MVARLISSSMSGSILPVDANGKPMPLLAAKLAEHKPLLKEEMKRIFGFKQLLQIESRKAATTRKLYLALQIVLVKDGDPLSKIELIDRYNHQMDIVGESILPVPRIRGSLVGSWEVSVGYCAIYDNELIPAYVKQILLSLPYMKYAEQPFKFDVLERIESIRPNGEWAHGSNASDMASTGRVTPDQI